MRVRRLRRVDPADLAAYIASSRRVATCQSASAMIDGKSEYRSAVAAAKTNERRWQADDLRRLCQAASQMSDLDPHAGLLA